MPINAITVADIADFADGHEFGEAGAYVRIRGIARGVLDPDAAENAGIVDLDKAPRNSAGLVEYATDVDMLRPKNMRRGSGILGSAATPGLGFPDNTAIGAGGGTSYPVRHSAAQLSSGARLTGCRGLPAGPVRL